MPLDLVEFARKLLSQRNQLQIAIAELSASTGISAERISTLESGAAPPSGDEVLILADFYKVDYKFFISNEKLSASEQTDSLYRRHGADFSKSDRWQVQEFLFLCECEEWLSQKLSITNSQFTFAPKGTFYKSHGIEAANALRKHFDYGPPEIPSDVYRDLRKLGVHVFRRELGNSDISGVTIRHPYAGACVLINYSEDVYRQRFTACHELAHVILDKEDSTVSLKRNAKELAEIRANVFSSTYLLPPETLHSLPTSGWNEQQILLWASKLKVNTKTLAIGLKNIQVISDLEATRLSNVRVPASEKNDPELAGETGLVFERKRILLKRGLSLSYVSLCFRALSEGFISNARAAEMLLSSEEDLKEIATLFRINLSADV